MDIVDYQYQLLALLPDGMAWSRDPEDDLGKLMLGLAEEFARIDERAKALLDESLPSKVTDLISEWETDYSLPDSCTIGAQTLEERRAALVQKFKIYGSQSREFLQELAAAIGIDITVNEYKARRFGDPFGEPWTGIEWHFIISIDAIVEDPANTALMAQLECVFRRIIHAHKTLIFTFIPLAARQTTSGAYRVTQSGAYRV